MSSLCSTEYLPSFTIRLCIVQFQPTLSYIKEYRNPTAWFKCFLLHPSVSNASLSPLPLYSPPRLRRRRRSPWRRSWWWWWRAVVGQRWLEDEATDSGEDLLSDSRVCRDFHRRRVALLLEVERDVSSAGNAVRRRSVYGDGDDAFSERLEWDVWGFDERGVSVRVHAGVCGVFDDDVRRLFGFLCVWKGAEWWRRRCRASRLVLWAFDFLFIYLFYFIFP